MSPRLAVTIGLDTASATFRDGEPIFGFKSRGAASRIGPVSSIQFAGHTIANAEVRVIDLPALQSAGVGERAMIFGADLLRGYTLIYDHQGKRIWFGSSTCKPHKE